MAEDTGTQPEPMSDAQAPAQGTADAGQPSPQPSQPEFDQVSGQADYSRKTEALKQEREAFEAEKVQWNQQAAPAGYQQGYSQVPQQGYSQVGQNPLVQQAIDQFGIEGAQNIGGILSQQEQSHRQQNWELAYRQANFEGSQKHGEDWGKHEYKDANGVQRNKIVDLMDRGLTLDQAWNAENPVNKEQILQDAHNQAKADLDRKDNSTPAAAPQVTPTGDGVGHAKTISEAWAQAEAEGS